MCGGCVAQSDLEGLSLHGCATESARLPVPFILMWPLALKSHFVGTACRASESCLADWEPIFQPRRRGCKATIGGELHILLQRPRSKATRQPYAPSCGDRWEGLIGRCGVRMRLSHRNSLRHASTPLALPCNLMTGSMPQDDLYL